MFVDAREAAREARRARRRLRKLRYDKQAARFENPFEDELYPLEVDGYDFDEFHGFMSREHRLPIT